MEMTHYNHPTEWSPYKVKCGLKTILSDLKISWQQGGHPFISFNFAFQRQHNFEGCPFTSCFFFFFLFCFCFFKKRKVKAPTYSSIAFNERLHEPSIHLAVQETEDRLTSEISRELHY